MTDIRDVDTVHDSGDGEHGDESYCAACNQSFSPETEICPNDGTKLVRFKAQKDEMIGRVLEGRFKVRQPLGKGGMGTVYRAIQVSVDREVAIKVVHPKLANDRQAAKRFLREARLSSRLNQPNIVNVIDFGQTEDGVLYLVMELLRGHTLAAELGHDRRFTVRRTATIALQLCDALEAAHAQGIVHRDLKPGNIVILDDPPGRDLLKVLDFGLAKSLVTDTTSQVTNTNAILGTPLYMSPEQVEGKPSDQRADLYSLGCILYELLSGTPPYVDTSANLLMAKHLTEVPPPLPAHVPPAIRAVVERMLAKKPEDRIQTAGDVRTAVQAAIEGGSLLIADAADTIPDVGAIDPALASTMTPPPGSIAGMNAVAPAPTGLVNPRRRGARGAWLALLVLVVGAGGGFAAIKLLRDRGAPTPAAPIAAPPGGVIDAAMAAQEPAVPAATVDAPPPPPPVDAAVKSSTNDDDDDHHHRHKPKPDAAPRTIPLPPPHHDKPDAEPTIDFYHRKPN